MNVRKARADDVDFMIEELKQFAELFESHRSLWPGHEIARQIIGGLIETQVCFVAEQDEKPVGFIVGLLTNHFFNPEIKSLAEMFWWVSKEHRNGRAGAMLLNRFIEFGKQNAHWVTMSLESKSPITDKALLKRGFKLNEKAFLLEVD